ncbi:MAG: OmpA family protein [Nitrospirae bacterium]|nr:OmpA family protein [Nitrospirota bacterium]
MIDEEESGNSGGGAPAWMATFSDMATLLLTFFILLLSFATMDIVKFRDAMGSIQQALGFMPVGTGMFQQSSKPTTIELPVAKGAGGINQQLSNEIKDMIEERGLQDDIDFESTPRGVILRVKGRLFFNPGDASLKPEAYPVLDRIAELIKKFPNRVSIEGHTDNIPIRNSKYASNWELSMARALSVLQFLTKSKGIDPKKLSIAGFADTRPIAPNDTPEGRAKNRRVEFVFYEE